MDGARVSALAVYRLQEAAGIIHKERPRRLQEQRRGRLLSLARDSKKKKQKQRKGRRKVSLTAGGSQAGLPKQDLDSEGEPAAAAPPSSPPAAAAPKQSRGPRRHKVPTEPGEPPTARAEERAGEPSPTPSAGAKRSGAPRSQRVKRQTAEPERALPPTTAAAADGEALPGPAGAEKLLSRGPRKQKVQAERAEPQRALTPTAPGREEEVEPRKLNGGSRKPRIKREAAEPQGGEDGEAPPAEKLTLGQKKPKIQRQAAEPETDTQVVPSPQAGQKLDNGPKKPKVQRQAALAPTALGGEDGEAAPSLGVTEKRKQKVQRQAAEPERALPPTAWGGEDGEAAPLSPGAARKPKIQRQAAESGLPTQTSTVAVEKLSPGPKRKKVKREKAEPGKDAAGEEREVEDGAKGELVEGQKSCGATSGAPSLQQVLQELGQIPHSKRRAARLFEWLIAPLPAEHFFSWMWEKDAVLVRRRNPDYYKGLFSTAELDAVLRGEDVQFGLHLDAARYRDGQRETLNPPGRAHPAIAWSLYQDGCSLRLLCPQAFSAVVWQVLSVLQEHFGSMMGANTYLTPPDSQGFAPHYDDIEAFVLQLEGRKLWRVYKPREPAEELPQFSSPNFGPSGLGKPVLQEVLEPGDLLYFPRGFIHQAECEPGVHSLHLTLSTFQRNSWGDLLEPLLPAALQAAMEEDVEFRRGLPRDFLDYMGVQHSESRDPRRGPFLEKVQGLLARLAKYAPVDAVADQRAKGFLHDCLPPVLSEKERALSVHGLPARWEAGEAWDVGAKITSETQVRLLRHGLTRLVSEDDSVLLYYTVENSRVYHQGEPKYLEIDSQYTDGIEYLFSSYPGFVRVGDLPCDNRKDQISLVTMLFEKGLLITKKPLTP